MITNTNQGVRLVNYFNEIYMPGVVDDNKACDTADQVRQVLVLHPKDVFENGKK